MESKKPVKTLELWKQAKKIIPGGSQLLSKRAEMFLPDQWPAYYKRAKGVEVTDLDDNIYIDMSIMGVGACILGYADDDVNRAVKAVIDNGSMSTLNAPEEVELAKLLLNLHPWAGMVRYTRSGGEALSVAVRIARAFRQKEKIAFCGYHGWHDWYLAGNLASERHLDGHLLPGLEPRGVPRGLLDTAIPFKYNEIEELEQIVKQHDIGVIIVESIRHEEPKNNFLQKIRIIANKINAVLIFDEVSSGFRLCVGGAYTKYGVLPDIVVYAKGISNGFPMGVVLGKTSVMDAAQTTFISSTYWTESIGPTAALATIKKMQKLDVPKHLDYMGKQIWQGWKKLAGKHGLKIRILGPAPLVTFLFEYDNAQEIRTLFTQEMLKRGFLASASVYVSYAHKDEHVNQYLDAVDEVFGVIKKAFNTNSVNSLLEGPVAHKEFKRLT